MIKYIIRRLITLVPIIIGVTLVVFTILEMTPGDPAKMMLGDGATLEQFEAFNDKFGLDKPFVSRFFNYILQLFTRLISAPPG